MKLSFVILILIFLTACSVLRSNPIMDTSEPFPSPEPYVSATLTHEPTDIQASPSISEDGGGNLLLPQPGDAGLSRGNVYLESTDLLILESYPIQFNLYLSGNLPTPCNQLRVQVNEPDAENRIYIEVYSVSDPNAMCVQVLEPFDTTISLGSFPTGHYTVFVNGEMIGEFDS
jgi:hypothetical protein